MTAIESSRLAEAAALADELAATRTLTLRLVDAATDDELRTAFDPDFSPLAWHLGHVAMFEARWVHERTHGDSARASKYESLFDPLAMAKQNRRDLPGRDVLLAYAADVRRRTLELLDWDSEHASHELARELFVYAFVLAHEQQHAETMATILRLRPRASRERSRFPGPLSGTYVRRPSLRIPAGVHRLGSDAVDAYDNERRVHEVRLGAFEIDGEPATNRDWLDFVAAGGYARKELWTEAGRRWLSRARVQHPSTWEATDGGFVLRAMSGDVHLPLEHPVEGISAFEAEAYATFRGARLPTEAEWEAAAVSSNDSAHHVGLACGATRVAGRGHDFVGNVWEWTSSTFAPYPGFRAGPYEGYSAPYFDGRHRVVRGGSWATQGRIARATFRNWYEPRLRAIFVGVRLARDV